jgi:predicted Zn finger-like uncharacterized protein
MLIKCPSCHARAKISESHEGAKVRCAECGRVFVARPAGAKGTMTSGSNNGLLLGALVGVVVLIVVVAIVRSSDEPPVTAKEPEAPVEVAPPAPLDYGWNAPLVQEVVGWHHAAAQGRREVLTAALHPDLLWESEHRLEDGMVDPAAPTFASLPAHERIQNVERWVDGLIAPQDEGSDLVANWTPYDGEIALQTDSEALVRLAVRPRSGGVENRWIEWKLASHDGHMKAYAWSRWLSADEKKAASRQKGYEVVTLSDGSRVHEREPEPLEHLDDTPEALRKEIDTLIATMLDLELTKEAARAQRRLVEIGKPAIPALLTRMYETPADTEPDRIRLNLLDQSLQRITGQSFGYAPGESGSVAGTTEERRNSSIRQWFAWWYKNQKRFEGLKEKDSDGLEELIELTPQEKAWLERHKDD